MESTNERSSALARGMPVFRWIFLGMFGGVWLLSVGDLLFTLGWQPVPIFPATVLTLTSGVLAAVAWRARDVSRGRTSTLLARLELLPKWPVVSVLLGALVLHAFGFVGDRPSVGLAGIGLMGLGFFCGWARLTGHRSETVESSGTS